MIQFVSFLFGMQIQVIFWATFFLIYFPGKENMATPVLWHFRMDACVLTVHVRFQLQSYYLNARKSLMGIQHCCGSLNLSGYSMNSATWFITYRTEPPFLDFQVSVWRETLLKFQACYLRTGRRISFLSVAC
ncbi:uncharacterized protein LOC123450255 [Hordeum vulgare subsp. vulgare]|uniref:uncharacterized protein LOC123450255 n=1 Tax=Hordeum vulgare subsp. vulgare TaxID=112509 RepID=UPI001D1A4758|nr:uncharacterized protein LOC123450255 [Hordeum vulgare subsp. vulgare]